MKWKRDRWIIIIFFLFGSLVSFILTRFHYFDIKKELDVPNLLLGGIGLMVGLFIADTIQKNITRSQNQYVYLENKLDSIWTRFSNYSMVFAYNDNVDVEHLSRFTPEVTHQLGFLKTVFETFEVETKCIESLEEQLENYEELFSSLTGDSNIIFIGERKEEIAIKTAIINKNFADVLREIQHLA